MVVQKRVSMGRPDGGRFCEVERGDAGVKLSGVQGDGELVVMSNSDPDVRYRAVVDPAASNELLHIGRNDADARVRVVSLDRLRVRGVL